jgi:hypothetical protein
MNSWDKSKSEYIETPKEVINFFNEIENICKTYGYSISHEDGHGAFIIEGYDPTNINWLKSAHLSIKM